MAQKKMSKAIEDLIKKFDQMAVNERTLDFWKILALTLAEEHQEEAKTLVDQIVAQLAGDWETIKKLPGDEESIFLDAISQFKAEAAEEGLR